MMAGLWIRSQNKAVLKQCNDFSIGTSGDKQVIFGTFGEIPVDYGMPLVLGYYESEERALQVLDEIQELICNLREEELSCIFYNGDFHMPAVRNNVYQMPAE